MRTLRILFIRYDSSVAETNHPLGIRRDIGFVSHQHDGHAAFVKLTKQLHDLIGHFGIECARWFVSEQQHRIGDHRSRNRHPLLLPARKLVGMVIHSIAEPDPSQRFGGAPERSIFGTRP